MEKKGTKIAYFIALAIVVIALVIAKVTNDGSGFIATGWALDKDCWAEQKTLQERQLAA